MYKIHLTRVEVNSTAFINESIGYIHNHINILFYCIRSISLAKLNLRNSHKQRLIALFCLLNLMVLYVLFYTQLCKVILSTKLYIHFDLGRLSIFHKGAKDSELKSQNKTTLTVLCHYEFFYIFCEYLNGFIRG